MAGQDVRVVDVCSAEVDETERHVVCQPHVVDAAYKPLLEIPVRDVVAGVAQDRGLGDEGGKEISPFLIDEQPAREIDPAIEQGATRPPPKRPSHLFGIAHRAEAQVVDPVLERQLVAELTVLSRFGQVWREHALRLFIEEIE